MFFWKFSKYRLFTIYLKFLSQILFVPKEGKGVIRNHILFTVFFCSKSPLTKSNLPLMSLRAKKGGENHFCRMIAVRLPLLFAIALIARKSFCTSEILNTQHLTPFFDNTISIQYSLPANKNTNRYCVPVLIFKRKFLRFLRYKYKYLKVKISYTQHEILSLNVYLSSF